MTGRFRFLRLAFAVSFGLIFFRLGQIMVLEHGYYKVLAYQQHVVETRLTADRGEIFTSDGYPLVVNTDAYLMFAVPAEMKDKPALIDQLVEQIIGKVEAVSMDSELEGRYKGFDRKVEVKEGEPKKYRNFNFPVSAHYLRYLYIPYEGEEEWQKMLKEDLKPALEKVLADDKNYFVQLISQLDYTDQTELSAKEWEGIHFSRQTKRSYPEGEMAAHVLGFVGKDESGDDKGYFGLEGFFDGDLSGRAGYQVAEKDIEGKIIPYGLSKLDKPEHGRDLTLTIRRELQFILERNMRESVKKYGAKNGTAILLDPQSGNIWAMVNYPSFYPEYWTEELRGESDVSKIDVFRNYAIAANYEPGSVLKPVTMSMALNEKLVTPETIYHDTGPVMYSGYDVRTWNNKYHNDINMMQVLQLSNNTGAAWVGHQVGFQRFADYVTKYHLGEATGVDLQGEEWGIVRDAREWRDIDLANMSFGQGISVTPIQVTAIFGALVNGGTLYRPNIVQKIVDHRPDKDLDIINPAEALSHPISAETSETIRYMLRSVVTDGEFKWYVKQAGMDRYSIGGKTGTAQIPFNGRYDPNKTNTTFIGFAPIDKPKFVMLVRFSQPSSSTYSADTAVPTWMNIAKELMPYFEIQPEN